MDIDSVLAQHGISKSKRMKDPNRNALFIGRMSSGTNLATGNVRYWDTDKEYVYIYVYDSVDYLAKYNISTFDITYRGPQISNSQLKLRGLVSCGARLYGMEASGKISPHDKNTLIPIGDKLTCITIPTPAFSSIMSDNNYIYIISENTLYKINPETDTIVAQVSVGINIRFMKIIRGKIYTNYGSPSSWLRVYDSTTLALLVSAPVSENIWDLNAIQKDILYVSGATTLYQYSLPSLTRIQSRAVDQPSAIWTDSIGDLYVHNNAQNVKNIKKFFKEDLTSLVRYTDTTQQDVVLNQYVWSDIKSVNTNKNVPLLIGGFMGSYVRTIRLFEIGGVVYE